MPYSEVRVIGPEETIIRSAVAIPVMVVAGVSTAIAKTISNSKKKSQEEERKRIAQERFSDKLNALISESDNTLVKFQEKNYVEILKFTQTDEGRVSTYRTYNVDIPDRVSKITNLVFHSSLDKFSKIKMNRNGSTFCSWNLSNENDYLDLFRLKTFEVSPGDLITLECELKEASASSEFFGLYILTPKGKLFFEKKYDTFDLNSPVIWTNTFAYTTKDGYGFTSLQGILTWPNNIDSIDLIIRVNQKDSYKDFNVTYEGRIQNGKPFVIGALIEDFCEGESIDVCVTKVSSGMAVSSFTPWESNIKSIVDAKPIQVYPEAFIDSLPKGKDGSIPSYYYEQHDGYYMCPYCGFPMSSDKKSCSVCHSDYTDAEKITEQSLKTLYVQWQEATRKAEELKRITEEKERIKKSKLTRIISLIILVAAIIFGSLYFLIIKPKKEQAEYLAAYKASYEAASEETKISMYPMMIEYGFLEIPTVTFLENGNMVSSINMMPGEAIGFPSGKDKNGKHFLGWMDVSTNEIVSSATMKPYDVQYVAVYGNYVRYLDFENNVIETSLVVENDFYTVGQVESLKTVVDTWKDLKSGESVKAGTKLVTDKDVEYKAVYSLHTIFYRQDGSVYYKSVNDYGEVIEFPSLASDPAFIGWSTNKNTDAEIIVPSSSITVTENNAAFYLRTKNIIRFKRSGLDYDVPEKYLYNQFEVETGYNYVLPSSFSMDNESYVLMGWLIDDKLYQEGESINVNGNLELTSIYSKLSWQGEVSANYLSAYVNEKGIIVDKPVNTHDLTLTEISDLRRKTEYRTPIDYFSVDNSNNNGALSLSSKGKKDAQRIEYLVIPEKINGMTIKELSYKAFVDCTKLKEVVLPSTITKISFNVFNSSELVFQNLDLTGVSFVDGSAFYGSTIKKIILNDNVINYGAWMRGMEGLESIEYANGTTTITNNVLNSDTRKTLKTVIIPEGVTKIEEYAFYSCTGLSSVILPKSIKLIGKEAFGHSNLYFEELDLSDVTKVGGDAFYNCRINNLTLSNYVVSYDGFWKERMTAYTVYVPRFTKSQFADMFPNSKIKTY